MLRKRIQAITKMDLSVEARKAACKDIQQRVSEFELCVFEYELSRGVLRPSAFKKKVEGVKPALNSSLQGRIDMYRAFTHLLVTQPPAYETIALPKFQSAIKQALRSLVRQDDEVDLDAIEKLNQAYLNLETELYIVAAHRYYDFDDQGNDMEDPDTCIVRLKEAANKILRPLMKKVSPADSKHDAYIERNLRLQDVLGIFEGGGYVENRFDHHIKTYDEEEIMMCALQFVTELQNHVYGVAKPPPRVSNNVVVNVQQSSSAATTISTKRKERREEEDEDEPPVAKRIKAAEAMKRPTTPPNVPSVATQRPALVFQPPPSRAAAAAAAAIVPKSEPPPPPSPAQEPVVMRRKRQAMGETQPDTPSPSASIASSASVMMKASVSGGTGGRTRFSESEDDALKKGVAKYGEGKWKTILEDKDFAGVFNSVKARTAVNLKDRWRNLNHK